MAATDELIDQIVIWADTLPTKEAILEYGRALPEEHLDVAYRSGTVVLRNLLVRKDQFFRNFPSSQAFVEVLPEYVQYEYIAFSAGYNPTSVAGNIIKKYPNLSTFAFPVGITEWAKDYCAKWVVGLTLAATPGFIRNSIYANSVLKTVDNQERLSQLITAFEAVYYEDGRRFDTGENLTEADYADQLEIFKALGFLPEENIRQLLDPGSTLEKFMLVRELITLFYILQTLGLENARTNPQIFLDELFARLQLDIEEGFLVQAEGKRLSNSEKAKQYEQLYAWLNQLWTEPNIENGLTEKQMIDYVHTLNRAQVGIFRESLYSFLDDSPVIEGILHGFDYRSVLLQLSHVSTTAQLNDLEKEVLPYVESEEQQTAIPNLFKLIYTVFRQLFTQENNTTVT